MCGRYNLRTSAEQIAEVFGVSRSIALTPRYNIAPTQQAPIIREQNEREMTLGRWGFIPSWSKEKPKALMINARGETAYKLPSFRSAFKRRRCLVPADGYYEWVRKDDAKQPYLMERSDGEVMGFAGLWETWTPPDNEDSITSFTIITTDSNPTTESVHDRMPVVIAADDFDLWLDPEMQDRDTIQELLTPWEGVELSVTAVSTHVNSARNDDPQCVEPV